MKRVLLTVVLVLVIISMLFTACGKTPATTDQNPSSESPSASSSGSSDKDKTIKLTYFNTSAEVNTMFEKMFARYNELNPNVVLN